MYIQLIENERVEVENFETSVKSWAMKLLFKKTDGGKTEPELLPININNLIDGDDANVIKRARKAAKEFFENRESGLINKDT